MEHLKRRKVLVDEMPTKARPTELSPFEAKHITQVLRLRNGDKVEVIDGKGKLAIAVLVFKGKSVFVDHREDKAVQTQTLGNLPITLELSILKGPAMDWSIEKAVELGVSDFIPIISSHTVVKTNKKDISHFLERWQRIADQSLKQCNRLIKMVVHEPLELNSLNPEANRIFCNENGDSKQPLLAKWLLALSKEQLHRGIKVTIGPEGGWSREDLEVLARIAAPVSLGPLTMRSETAVVSATSVIASCYHFSMLDKV
ncbi:MAG: hypothetical protein A3K03_12355 [Bdellovibrionales bacterium RIFOXYD1_FULL_44_7]|nr:MAG: hypothetical protein A3K03_12355 [Bdellovibrionales bacterium RIFOXYD1_FULL_44_7]